MAKAATLVRSYAAAGLRQAPSRRQHGLRRRPGPAAGGADRRPRDPPVPRSPRPSHPAAPSTSIGTEVPVPGGAHEAIEQLEVTRTQDARGATIELHRPPSPPPVSTPSWQRVIAVVVQPGVEFGTAQVVDFVPERARGPARPGSTERTASCSRRIRPTTRPRRRCTRWWRSISPSSRSGRGLTFALREALFALAAIEAEMAAGRRALAAARGLEAAMLADPSHWQGHYPGTADEQRLARAFSLSDRAATTGRCRRSPRRSSACSTI